jgi:hypothetical protein
MTEQQVREMIQETAGAAREEGQTIEINERLPYVAINRGNDSDYFFQGEEAVDLLDEAEAAASVFNVSVEDYLLYSAQGW